MPRISSAGVPVKVIAVFQNGPQQTILINTKFVSDWTYCQALSDMLPLQVCMPGFRLPPQPAGTGTTRAHQTLLVQK